METYVFPGMPIFLLYPAHFALSDIEPTKRALETFCAHFNLAESDLPVRDIGPRLEPIDGRRGARRLHEPLDFFLRRASLENGVNVVKLCSLLGLDATHRHLPHIDIVLLDVELRCLFQDGHSFGVFGWSDQTTRGVVASKAYLGAELVNECLATLVLHHLGHVLWLTNVGNEGGNSSQPHCGIGGCLMQRIDNTPENLRAHTRKRMKAQEAGHTTFCLVCEEKMKLILHGGRVGIA